MHPRGYTTNKIRFGHTAWKRVEERFAIRKNIGEFGALFTDYCISS